MIRLGSSAFYAYTNWRFDGYTLESMQVPISPNAIIGARYIFIGGPVQLHAAGATLPTVKTNG